MHSNFSEIILEQIIDQLEINEFPEKFDYNYWEYSAWIRYGEIRLKSNYNLYLRYTILRDWYHLDTIYAPWKWSELLLALFYQARIMRVSYIHLNARTNDEEIMTQEELENWYRKFWFETLSYDTDGTKMKAKVENRPISYRYKELLNRISSEIAWVI